MSACLFTTHAVDLLHGRCRVDNHVCAQVNDKYTGTFVFDNDFPSLEPTMPVPTEEDQPGHPLLRFGEARGEW